MARDPNPKPDDAAQSKRFADLAKELGADTADDDLPMVVKTLANRKPERRRKLGKKAADK